MGILSLIPWTITSLLGNVLPSAVVAGLENHWELKKYLLTIMVLVLAMWVCNLAQNIIESFVENSKILYRNHYSEPFIDKKMKLDYDVLEQKDFQTISSASYTAIYQGRGIDESVTKLAAFLCYFIPALVYAGFLVRVSIWIVVLALLSSVLQIYFLKFAREKHGEAHPILSNFASKLSYLTNQTMDTAACKDIRIFQMQKWLMKKYTDNLNGMNQVYYKVHDGYFLRNVGDAGIEFFRNGLIYAYLIYLTSIGKLSLAEFVLYFGFVNTFAERMMLALREGLSLGIISNTFSSIRDYFETPEARNGENRVDNEVLEQIKQQPVSLELRDVTYIYENQTNPTISHLNLKITSGEKLALIGLNGAGKTTLVKLICGFYAPTSGEILLNGINIEEFNHEQYYSLISVLFQDYTVLPLSLEENIASAPKDLVDEKRLEEALMTSGFKVKYESLLEKGDSMLVPEIHLNAVDFSGGEKQRMLFARALYKKAPLLILDEPTAALDPIAENEIYLKYSDATKDKTSIYISHRLSSTRFCDRIVLLANGQIIESGTHDELMDRQGEYANLYEMQSKYYREQEKEELRRMIMED
jgi:ABC-type multidrug transport system fused ATPase/permease subunit